MVAVRLQSALTCACCRPVGVKPVDPFPEEIQKFLDANIDSVEQLEILRIVAEVPDREWCATALVREVQARPQDIAAHMTALHARGLLTLVMLDKDVHCKKGARTPELAAQIACLLQQYGQRPVTMINMVHARRGEPSRVLQTHFD